MCALLSWGLSIPSPLFGPGVGVGVYSWVSCESGLVGIGAGGVGKERPANSVWDLSTSAGADTGGRDVSDVCDCGAELGGRSCS